mmetsp:Transcript_28347/g.74415  ORF Transcript_28347/g.74415 Transcript_28347/m.74415 type:complete len:200 (+) Transcript_28347:1-600(+)
MAAGGGEAVPGGLAVLCCGGTIDKGYDEATGAFVFREGAVKEVFDEVELAFPATYRTVCLKDSMDMTADDVDALASACVDVPADRVLVTHGTSTIVRSARTVALALDAAAARKTVVLTGSLRPRVFSTSDADFNLGVAVGALAVLPPGVFVAMSGAVHRYDAVARDPTDGRFVPATTAGCVAGDDPGITVTLEQLGRRS